MLIQENTLTSQGVAHVYRHGYNQFLESVNVGNGLGPANEQRDNYLCNSSFFFRDGKYFDGLFGKGWGRGRKHSRKHKFHKKRHHFFVPINELTCPPSTAYSWYGTRYTNNNRAGYF
jgi:hypothetical protein